MEEYVQFGFKYRGERVHFSIKGGSDLRHAGGLNYELLNAALKEFISLGGFKPIEPCK